MNARKYKDEFVSIVSGVLPKVLAGMVFSWLVPDLKSMLRGQVIDASQRLLCVVDNATKLKIIGAESCCWSCKSIDLTKTETGWLLGLKQVIVAADDDVFASYSGSRYIWQIDADTGKTIRQIGCTHMRGVHSMAVFQHYIFVIDVLLCAFDRRRHRGVACEDVRMDGFFCARDRIVATHDGAIVGQRREHGSCVLFTKLNANAHDWMRQEWWERARFAVPECREWHLQSPRGPILALDGRYLHVYDLADGSHINTVAVDATHLISVAMPGAVLAQTSSGFELIAVG